MRQKGFHNEVTLIRSIRYVDKRQYRRPFPRKVYFVLALAAVVTWAGIEFATRY